MVVRRSPFALGFRICFASLLLTPGLKAQTDGGTDANREMRPPTGSALFNSYTPQTQTERLHYYFFHMFSAESVLRSAMGAGIDQALNTPHEWSQGTKGYLRRFGSSYGEHVIQSTVMYGMSAALHEDNRYFRSGKTGFGPRLKYAIASSFLARHDDGSRHFSFSRISSYGASAALSREWQPPSTDKWKNALNSFGISVGVETGFNVAREFLPLLHSLPSVR
jgi:hypothetical protein